VRVEHLAPTPWLPVVRIHDQEKFIDSRRNAVGVFVSQNNDGILALAPGRRLFDSSDDSTHRRVAAQHQGGVETFLSAVVDLVIGAKSTGIALPRLIVALIRRDEGTAGTEPDCWSAYRPSVPSKSTMLLRQLPGCTPS